MYNSTDDTTIRGDFRASDNERRYLFLHVPKTAGSAFRSIVNNNFRDASAIENPLLSTQIYSAAQINWLFASYPYRFYAGHVFRLKSALAACSGGLQLLAFVRDPVDKAMSSYYYLRNRSMTKNDHPVKLHSFVDLCARAERGGLTDSNGFDDSQLDWLVGERYAQLDSVEAAVASGQLLLFPTEHFDVAMVILERLFPRDFSNCAYGSKVNASTYAVNRHQTAEREAAQTLPWISDDLLLHKTACLNLQNITAKVFISDKELKHTLNDFHRRCTAVSTATRDQRNTGSLRMLRRLNRQLKGWIS